MLFSKGIFVYLVGYIWTVGGFAASVLLSTPQIRIIRNILNHPETPLHIRIRTQQIIAEKYYFWTLKQVSLFKQTSSTYRFYANSIMTNELRQYAFSGLMKSILLYNGSGYFNKYAEKYVRGELCFAVTERIPMQPLKHHELFVLKQEIPRLSFASFLEHCPLESPPMVLEHATATEVKEIMMKYCSVELRRMFFYRYDVETLKPIRTIHTVCTLMAFSEETYRNRMKQIHSILRENLMQKPYKSI